MEDFFKTVFTLLGAPLCMWFWFVLSNSLKKSLIKDTGWKWLKYPFAVADCSYAGVCGYALAIELTRMGLFISSAQ